MYAVDMFIKGFDKKDVNEKFTRYNNSSDEVKESFHEYFKLIERFERENGYFSLDEIYSLHNSPKEDIYSNIKKYIHKRSHWQGEIACDEITEHVYGRVVDLVSKILELKDTL